MSRSPVPDRVRLLGAMAVVGALLGGCNRGSTRAATRVPVTTTVRPAPTTTTSTTVASIAYTVKRGDTLSAIARHFGIPVAVVTAANHITDPNQLKEGQVLAIPPPPPPPPTTRATTTLAPAPVKLVVKPVQAALGAVFSLDLTGAKPSETVTFEIDSPGGRKFTGPPHTPAPDGSVSTIYVTTAGDPPGTYTVIVAGTLGTSARATFAVTPAP